MPLPISVQIIMKTELAKDYHRGQDIDLTSDVNGKPELFKGVVISKYRLRSGDTRLKLQLQPNQQQTL
jgi:hypothetical protein